MNIVFDLGAVLFTWDPVRLLQSHFADHVPNADAARVLAAQMFHHDDWLGFDRGAHALDEAVERMSSRLSLPEARLGSVLASVGEVLAPIDSSIALLDALRLKRDAGEDLALYYLSNMPRPYARYLEAHHDCFAWFDGGIFSGDVQLLKPDPRLFELLAERYSLEGESTVFIDDSAANVMAARALGWAAIHCTTPRRLSSQLDDYLAPLNSTLSTSKPRVRA